MALYQLQKAGVAHSVKCSSMDGKKRFLFPAANDFSLRKQIWLQIEAYDTPSFSGNFS